MPAAWGCWAVAAAYGVFLAALLAVAEGNWSRAGLAFLAAPLAFATCYQVYGRALLLAAHLRWRARGIRGVMVYSRSPHWQSYIESEWLPSAGSRLRILNWSDRKAWPAPLVVRLFRFFVGDHRNFNPAVVLLRGVNAPLVFRFYNAFRDARHGRPAALKRLERRLFAELDCATSDQVFPR